MLPHVRVAGSPPTSQTMPLLTIGGFTELGSALPRQSPIAPGIPVAPTKPFRVSVAKRPNLRLRDLALPILPTRSRVKGLTPSVLSRRCVYCRKLGAWRSDLAPLHGRHYRFALPYRGLPRARWLTGFRPNAAGGDSGAATLP